jgi:hypothetical protein
VGKIFISYSHADADSARHLEGALAGHGVDVRRDADEPRPGAHVQAGLGSSDAMVVLIGSEPTNTARNAWSQALQMTWDPERDLSLVPVLLPGAQAPAFLQDQPLIRVEDGWDWDRIAAAVEKSPPSASARQLDAKGKAALADRLAAIQKVAATLPDDPQDQG